MTGNELSKILINRHETVFIQKDGRLYEIYSVVNHSCLDEKIDDLIVILGKGL